MCQSDGVKASLPKPMTSASAAKERSRAVVSLQKKQQYGNRGSWLRFLTNSFHGVLGASSLMVTLMAWISNEYFTSNNALPLVLTLLSVITTTVLSIHSSWYMLEQSPHQSTILDCQLELRSNKNKTKDATSAAASNNSLRLWVVAPHRGAFHRTSIIMQYANARILLLLQRKHWLDPSASAPSTSGILLWGLVFLMCLRMLLGEKLPSPVFLERFRATTAKRKTISSAATSAHQKAEITLKPLPPFWKNGNTYCFVLPMIASVCADFAMSVRCEYSYFSMSPTEISKAGLSLFDYYSDHWLSLWHLLFLQVVAHVIAFAFTLAFRIKHTSKKKDTETSSNTSSSLARKFYNIRTLYWVCTIGVYTLVIVGLAKARTTLTVSR